MTKYRRLQPSKKLPFFRPQIAKYTSSEDARGDAASGGDGVAGGWATVRVRGKGTRGAAPAFEGPSPGAGGAAAVAGGGRATNKDLARNTVGAGRLSRDLTGTANDSSDLARDIVGDGAGAGPLGVAESRARGSVDRRWSLGSLGATYLESAGEPPINSSWSSSSYAVDDRWGQHSAPMVLLWIECPGRRCMLCIQPLKSGSPFTPRTAPTPLTTTTNTPWHPDEQCNMA